ncbi:MAG: putative signal transducing protein [Fidelibacterota bacterium]
MSYCPKCKYEFEDDVKICPDCKKELVEKKPVEQHVERKWVTLDKMTSSVMADMLKEALEENEINCLEKSDMFHSAFAMESTSMAGGAVEILVPADQINKAKNILEQINDRVT